MDLEEQSQLNHFISSLPQEGLKTSTVYDPDGKSMNAHDYAQLYKLLD
jgi:hypothetical protein